MCFFLWSWRHFNDIMFLSWSTIYLIGWLSKKNSIKYFNQSEGLLRVGGGDLMIRKRTLIGWRSLWGGWIWAHSIKVMPGRVSNNGIKENSWDSFQHNLKHQQTMKKRVLPSDQMSALKLYGSSLLVSHFITSGAILSREYDEKIIIIIITLLF